MRLHFIIERPRGMNFNECQPKQTVTCHPAIVFVFRRRAMAFRPYHCHKTSVSSQMATNLANCQK